jgi:hypothetical protein
MPINYFKLEDLKDGLEAISDLIGVYLPDLPEKNLGKKDIQTSEFVKHFVKLIFHSDYQLLGYDC